MGFSLDELEPIITVRYPGERFDPEVSRQAQAWMAYPDTSTGRQRDTGFAPVKVRVREEREPRADESWRERAACRGMPTEWWFPTVGQVGKVARGYCRSCPVGRECGTYGAMEQYGIWGGMNTEERRDERRPGPTVADELIDLLAAAHARLDGLAVS
jgi:hypothetical protein